LEKIDGVTDIQTDIVNRTCSFKVTKPSVDVQAQLNEYAKSNEHLAGFTIK